MGVEAVLCLERPSAVAPGRTIRRWQAPGALALGSGFWFRRCHDSGVPRRAFALLRRWSALKGESDHARFTKRHGKAVAFRFATMRAPRGGEQWRRGGEQRRAARPLFVFWLRVHLSSGRLTPPLFCSEILRSFHGSHSIDLPRADSIQSRRSSYLGFSAMLWSLHPFPAGPAMHQYRKHRSSISSHSLTDSGGAEQGDDGKRRGRLLLVRDFLGGAAMS